MTLVQDKHTQGLKHYFSPGKTHTRTTTWRTNTQHKDYHMEDKHTTHSTQHKDYNMEGKKGE